MESMNARQEPIPGRRPRLLLSAFVMNTPSHITGGTWRHPEAQQHRYNDLEFWTDLARTLEDAKFDAIFFADVVGLYGDDDGGWASHVRRGLQVPANDPFTLLAALAATTKDLGLALTSSVVQSHPFHFARQLSTLDHLSKGRTAWNIVTSRLENTHKNFGAKELLAHGDRYDWAEEYVDAVYKLWEGSWDDGSLPQDKSGYVHGDPDHVHKIYHRGERYSIDGPHLVSPSAQRTPLLFQAGSSGRGQAFGAANAEATFIMAGSPDEAAGYTKAVREQAVAHGRRPEDIAFFQGLNIVVGSTEAEAKAKAAELDEYSDPRARLAHMGGMMGVDLGRLPLDTPLGDFESEGAKGFLEQLARRYPNRRPTLREFIEDRTSSERLVGTPEQIVDQLERWQDAGVDGINLINSLLPGTYVDFIEGVLPELRSRGLAQSSYAPGTLREKLFGNGPHLNDRHPAARYRGAFADHSATAENLPADLAPATAAFEVAR